MKRFVVLLLSITAMGRLQAQDLPHTIKAGLGYTHEFPGMSGYTISGEYIFPLTGQFEGGMGLKSISLQGYPRTAEVQEFTKAQTIDFAFYWVPLHTDASLIRAGIGYSFSFYSIKRSDPITVDNGIGKTITWPVSYSNGRMSGFNAMAEYEYRIPGSALSVGLRAALYKVYDETFFIGPAIGFNF